MNKIFKTFSVALAALALTACVKDLDVTPKDPDMILGGNLDSNPVYMEQVLGKIYASFIINGQGANGGADISAPDNDFFTTGRALWNLQEITTDEAICAWGDAGIADLNTQTWSPSNPFLTALYQRLGLSITYANDFIKRTKDKTDPQVVRYNAEARFLRALAYYYHMDLFGNPPFTTEDDGVGKFYPKQIKRADLFNYIVKELQTIEPLMGEPKFSYPQADKAAVWMLLARIYLNAEVYTGTAKWDSCKIWSDKVINSGAYDLASNYRQNFTADNDSRTNPEMIFSWALDGTSTQGSVGSTFLIQSTSDGTYINAVTDHDLPNNPNWNGNRGRKDFMNILVDTLATYGNVSVPADDKNFSTAKDKRIYLRQKKSINIPSASSSGDFGIGVWKFTNRKANGGKAENYNAQYSSTDWPVFRLADAYLMRAEALFNLNQATEAVKDINRIRERAYGNTSGNITVGQLNEQFLLDERAREFYYEAHRRTDLVRFGKFTGASYKWQWKGGVYAGAATDSYRDIFPIPGDEVAANPNIMQNPGY